LSASKAGKPRSVVIERRLLERWARAVKWNLF
jgi:hypothetical protein